jgi:hypothetical protein
VHILQGVLTIGEIHFLRHGDAMNEDLRRTLARLHAELGSASSMDEESRRLLQEVMRDAERLRTQSNLKPHSVGDRLEAMAVRFETDHPTLGTAIRELMRILESAGV